MRTPGRAPVPAGACDCHLHVFGPRARYAYASGRAYTPPDASLAQYRWTMRRIGLTRAVLVQPSVYGADNRAMLAALRRGGPVFRAVAVIDAAARERDLARLHDAGVRGVRLNMLFPGARTAGDRAGDPAGLAERIAPLGWHLQLLTDVSRFPDLARRLGRLPVDLVFDHLGQMPAAPGRALWGSDWPHPAFAGPTPDAAELLDLLLDWTGDADLARRVLVDNPARLYSFEAPKPPA